MYKQLIKSTESIEDVCTATSIAMTTEDETRKLVVQQLRLPGTIDPLLAKNFDDILEKLVASNENPDERWDK